MKPRFFYADALRAIAILYVVTSHAFAGVCWGMNDFSPLAWNFFNVCNSIIRLCVPTFVMLSGMLLLGSTRDESYIAFVWRRYSKIVMPFFAWSMIYAFYDAKMFGRAYTPWAAVLKFLAGPTAGHLYFMYIILGVYLVAPILKAFVRSASRRDQAVVLALWWSYLVLQFFFPDQMGGGPGTTLIEYSGYFLLGHVLNQTDYFEKWTGWLIALCVLIVAGNAYASKVLTVANDGGMVERFYYGFTPLVALYAGAFFVVVKQTLAHVDPAPGVWWSRGIGLLSRESYNLYLIHVAFMWAFSHGHFGFTLSESTGGSPFIGVPLYAALTLAATLLLTAGLKRIPILRQVFVLDS